MLAFLSSAHAASDDCPRGAEYVATASTLAGAAAVAADGVGFLVAAPEALDQATRVVRVEFGGDGTVTLPFECDGINAPIAIDAASDGTIALADACGIVWIGGANAWRKVGEGTLEEPSGVSFHPAGLAIADRRLCAVLVTTRDGLEIARLGADQLGDPRGVASLEDGTVFVADRLRDCVWRFSAGGDGMPTPQGIPIGEFGSSPRQFNAPCDVATHRNGDSVCIYVADELNHRIQVLDSDGRFVGFFGMHALIPRMGEGKIHYPRGVAVSRDGKTLAVAEGFEDRVQLFSLMAEPVPPPLMKSPELISSHFGAEVACAGDVLALIDIETEAVGILDARTTPPIHVTLMGGSGASPQRFGEVSAIAVEPSTRRVWIADRARGVIDVYALAFDPAKEPIVDLFMPRLVRSMRLENFARRLTVPTGRFAVRTPDLVDIAFASQDATRVFLLDRANMAVIVTDPRCSQGDVVLLPDAARTPEELAVAADGTWAVADPVAQAVFVRAPTGAWSALRSLGDLHFVRPSGVEFVDDGAVGASAGLGRERSMVVSDAARDGVIIGAVKGPARFVGEKGGLDEQFWDPQAIALSPRGHIVVDRGNHRFQRFGDQFTWNLTGSMGRYYDRKRRGSPGTTNLPESSNRTVPVAPDAAANTDAAKASLPSTP